ncbi:MAG: lipopolysaccharide kinase [Actinobacteria bacterium 13_2_20CM_2_71_6]|nr:MAG: lipopolysaccharide kinase [Actinobacteria bacterium 13_2_20CM_2_71_6]
MRITSAFFNPALLDLPWSTPLEEWPADRLVALPQGISRHVVRFVKLAGTVYAVKETAERIAQREYDLLRQLERIDAPSVEAVAIVADRVDDDGEPLEPVLVTRHLQFSLPYRALFSHTLRPDTMNRLLDALAALLVRMHLYGFFWGDVSLSNTLFRRDAGAFAAYLVDAETGALHPQLSRGQREEDVEIARVNIFGEMLDLAAAGLLHEGVDPEVVADDVVRRYESLWHELTYEQEMIGDREVRHHVEKRIRRLNELGFDVGELQLAVEGHSYRVRPKVVDAGHHTRRLLRLTGLDAEENQARKLLNDLDTYRAESDLDDEQQAAHRWLTEVFAPVVRAVPSSLRGKLEPTELFVQVIEHRWYMSEKLGRDVGLAPAVQSYLDNVLAHYRDEQAILGFEPGGAATAGSLSDLGEA